MVFNLSSLGYDYDYQYTWIFCLCPPPKKTSCPERENLPYYDRGFRPKLRKRS